MRYLGQFLFSEKLRGLDFSRRDISLIHSANHGYAMTSMKALKNINEIVPFCGKNFLDIGSGKGFVLVSALELGAARCTGIEFNSKLHQIAAKNIRKLGLNNQIKLENLDAQLFESYAEFEILFLFNPFEQKLYGLIIEIIFAQISIKAGTYYLICYGDFNKESVMIQSNIVHIYSGICPDRRNQVNVFKISTY